MNKVLFGALLAAALWPQAGLAQAQFRVRAQQGTIITNLRDGDTLTFNSEGIGNPVNAAVTVTYVGSQTAAIGAFELTGTTDFSVTTSPVLPVTLNPNDSVTFLVSFTPTSAGRLPGRLVVPFAEGVRIVGSNTINLSGVTPEFGFSYVPLPRGNQNSIANGGTIAFADTAVNQTNAVTFIIANRGTGPGTMQNVVLAGAQFTVGGVPLLPAVIPAGQEVRLTLTYAPLQIGASSGSVRVEFVVGGGTINLTANGTGPAYSYEFVSGSSTRPVSANDTLTLPPANLTERSSVTMRVRNTGNADGVISAIAVSGASTITLNDVPFLPVTLTPGSTISFNVQFLPTLPETSTARLRIGDVSFNLTGTGLGSTLAYAFSVGAATTTVVNNGSVILPPTGVGATSQARFTISNTGNNATFVNSISIPGTTVFTVTGVPALPARVDGGGSISFTINFTPTVIGAATASLKVDALSFTVSSVGSDPPALPTVTFPGAAATADAAQLVTVAVSLGQAYPVNLTGRLLLTFASDVFADDPGIQFAQGGRALNFVIPAGQTRANFGVNQTDVRLQTGTVAGTITLAATFATEAGAINLTPTVAPATTITVRPAAPRIRSVQLSTRTTTGFTILVTGYATNRNVTQMAFQFTQATDPANTDLKLDTTSLNLNVEGPFAAWYQSAAATPFGSQFTASISFNIRGDIDAIQSVSVTATNAQGTSNSGSVNLR